MKSRRELLKAGAGLPLLGAFAYANWSKERSEKENERRVYESMGVEGNGRGEGMVADAPAVIKDLRKRSPNDTIRLGMIGYGSRGTHLMRSAGFMHPDESTGLKEAAEQNSQDRRLAEWMEHEDLNLQLTGVCDLFDVRAERAIAAGENETRREGAPASKDIRRFRHHEELLADKDIDAVIVATSDNWHAQIILDAVSAGKHAYVEKALTRTMEEVDPVVKALRGSKIVFQLGHQNRQLESYEKARQLVERGTIGEVHLVQTTTNRNDNAGAWLYDIDERGSEKTIDWEKFQKPSSNKVPFSAERFFRWRLWYDYGTGLAGDLLSHDYDAMNQILQLGIPKSAVASGGIYEFKDGRDVPDVFHVVYEYPDRELTFMYSATLANGRGRGKMIMGKDATMEVGGGIDIYAESQSEKFKALVEEGVIDPADPVLTYRPGIKGVDAVTSATEAYFAKRGLLYTYRGGKRVDTSYLHIKDWLDCIRHGGTPACGIDRAEEEAITCHMATMAYREKRRVEWDPVNRRIV